VATRMPEERRLAIAAAVRRQPLVRAGALADQFGVSIETVRRDLLVLEHKGILERVYGGARGVPVRSFEPPVGERRFRELAAKKAMAAVVVSMLSPGNTVILDVGTSVAEVARQLPWDFRGRVLTPSLPVAAALDGHEGIEVLVCGGQLRHGDMALSGPQAERFFSDFYVDKAILGSGGIHARAGLTDYYPAEVAVRQTILEHAAETYVLADATKVGHVALCKVCELRDLTAVITDWRVEPESAASLEAAGATVIVAEVNEPRLEADAHESEHEQQVS
jgi:DeoR family transcriptional regulator, fructose operon transcriptional repressor